MLKQSDLLTYQEKPKYPLEIGSSAPLYVRHESVNLGLGGQSYKLLFASDLHFAGEGSLGAINQLIAATKETKPDLVLLGGDLVDFPHGISFLQFCVTKLSKLTQVWAISGNHDQWLGLPKVREAVLLGNGQWLEDESVFLEISPIQEQNKNCVNSAIARKTLRIDGYIHPDIPPSNLKILCAHNPIIFSDAVNVGYKLIFAGHLHGCQCILSENQGLFYPGAWFYRWNGRRFTLNDATLLVSRGMGDTLPIRWNCPREVIVCKIY
ncbi:MAG: metallophosphoesterase [Cyanobacteria bacterium P01_A01_bin.84]